MITEDILLDKMIDAGACTGLDKKNCIKAIRLVFQSGEAKLSLVKAIMGDDFDTFGTNYRAAIDRIQAESDGISSTKEEEVPAEPHGASFYDELH